MTYSEIEIAIVIYVSYLHAKTLNPLPNQKGI